METVTQNGKQLLNVTLRFKISIDYVMWLTFQELKAIMNL